MCRFRTRKAETTYLLLSVCLCFEVKAVANSEPVCDVEQKEDVDPYAEDIAAYLREREICVSNFQSCLGSDCQSYRVVPTRN